MPGPDPQAFVEQDRYGQRDGDSDRRRDVAFHAQNRERHEKEDDGKGRDERGHPQIACGS